MKKTYILFPVGILSVAIGASLAYASSAAFTVSLNREDLALAPTSIRTNLTANVYNEGQDTSDNNQLEASGTIKNEDNSDSDTKRNNTSSSTLKGEANFQINGDQERSNTTRGLLISEMAQVHSGNDLHAFVQALIKNNHDIKDVTTKEASVSVTRTVPTKLFGFIPLSTKETAEIISWGNGTEQVNVSRSWWNIFSKDEVATDTISMDIESRIKNIPTSEFKATLDATTKARLIAGIEAAFEANGSASSTITN